VQGVLPTLVLVTNTLDAPLDHSAMHWCTVNTYCHCLVRRQSLCPPTVYVLLCPTHAQTPLRRQVMQALSHFSYHKSGGQMVLCDLQGGMMSRGRGAVLTGRQQSQALTRGVQASS